MTGFRNLLFNGKLNFWCGNGAFGQISTNDVLFCKKFIRSFRSSRNQTPTRLGLQDARPLPECTNGIEMGTPTLRRAWKPILFTVAFSSGSLAGAAIWQYENARSRSKMLLKTPSLWLEEKVFHPKRGSWRRKINRWWSNLREGEKLFYPICFINVLVYLAWKLPSLQKTMLTYFCANPSSRIVCLPLVLSTFSHYSLLHLCTNMYVLHSFCEGAVSSLGKEQFLGFYLASGCFASLTSHLYKSAIGIPGLSLGASGAIMAIIGYICCAHPKTELSIIFLPFLRFEAGTAIKSIMALDTAGLVFRWKFFDHAAHLGGALAGIMWCYYGNYLIWQNRKYVVRIWHDLRTSFE